MLKHSGTTAVLSIAVMSYFEIQQYLTQYLTFHLTSGFWRNTVDPRSQEGFDSTNFVFQDLVQP
jgi:hypothetical protein